VETEFTAINILTFEGYSYFRLVNEISAPISYDSEATRDNFAADLKYTLKHIKKNPEIGYWISL